MHRGIFVVLLATSCGPEPVARAPSPSARPEAPVQGVTVPAPDPSRSPRWATALVRPGLPNSFRVTEGYYRGAQPSAEGMEQLASMGVKTVLNLRSFHSDRDEIGSLPLRYEHIRMNAWHPEDEDVVRFLQIVTDPANQPVFVHCQHGSDRTGTLTAVYRIAVQGWTRDEAIDEMMRGGTGFHAMWTNLTGYVRELDVERVQRDAGLTASGSERSADSHPRSP